MPACPLVFDLPAESGIIIFFIPDWGPLMNNFRQNWWRCLFGSVMLSFLMPLPGHAAAGAAVADPLPALVTSILESYGGKAALTGVKSVVARGTIADFMKNKEGQYARFFAPPQKLRIEIMADQGGEIRILDGMRGWQGHADALKEVRPVALQSMIYQYTYLDLPMGLADSSVVVTYGGKHILKGRQADLLLVEAIGAPKLRVYVDPVNRLIVRVAADFDMGMGASELSTEYEDFRPVGKVRFPFRLVNYAGEMKLSVISLSDIQVNTDLPKEIFSPNPTPKR